MNLLVFCNRAVKEVRVLWFSVHSFVSNGFSAHRFILTRTHGFKS